MHSTTNMWLPDQEQICLVRGPISMKETHQAPQQHIAKNLYKILPELRINISLALQHAGPGLKRPETSHHVSSSKRLYSLERTQNRSSVSRDLTKIPRGHMQHAMLDASRYTQHTKEFPLKCPSFKLFCEHFELNSSGQGTLILRNVFKACVNPFSVHKKKYPPFFRMNISQVNAK